METGKEKKNTKIAQVPEGAHDGDDEDFMDDDDGCGVIDEAPEDKGDSEDVTDRDPPDEDTGEHADYWTV